MMKSNTMKTTLVALGLLVATSSMAEIITCPSLQGRFSQDQEIIDSKGQAIGTFWTDNFSSQVVNVDSQAWGQVVKQKGKNAVLLCRKAVDKAKSTSDYYGTWRFIEAKQCNVIGNGQFNCE